MKHMQYMLVLVDAIDLFSYSEKESQLNDTLLHFKEYSNEHNCDRSCNITQSNLVYINV